VPLFLLTHRHPAAECARTFAAWRGFASPLRHREALCSCPLGEHGIWWIVEADDKKRARLSCIAHLLSQIPYAEIPHDTVRLPERIHNPDYHRGPVPADLFVPAAN